MFISSYYLSRKPPIVPIPPYIIPRVIIRGIFNFGGIVGPSIMGPGGGRTAPRTTPVIAPSTSLFNILPNLLVFPDIKTSLNLFIVLVKSFPVLLKRVILFIPIKI